MNIDSPIDLYCEQLFNSYNETYVKTLVRVVLQRIYIYCIYFMGVYVKCKDISHFFLYILQSFSPLYFVFIFMGISLIFVFLYCRRERCWETQVLPRCYVT